MELETVTLKLPRVLLRDAQGIASAREVSLGHILRELLKREVARAAPNRRSHRADGRLLAALQALLASDMAAATGWDDLRARMAMLGYVLRPSGGGLCVHRRSDGMRLCKASEIGFAYATLVERFGTPLAGHPHRMGHVTGNDDGFDVIER